MPQHTYLHMKNQRERESESHERTRGAGPSPASHITPANLSGLVSTRHPQKNTHFAATTQPPSLSSSPAVSSDARGLVRLRSCDGLQWSGYWWLQGGCSGFLRW
ncbi:hypothetical protein Hdeb2414_s0009g00317961 [Helianthus debilis subsp. tardiflorus]